METTDSYKLFDSSMSMDDVQKNLEKICTKVKRKGQKTLTAKFQRDTFLIVKEKDGYYARNKFPIVLYIIVYSIVSILLAIIAEGNFIIGFIPTFILMLIVWDIHNSIKQKPLEHFYEEAKNIKISSTTHRKFSFLPYAVAAVVFIVLSIIYVSPVLDGKVLHSSDGVGWQGQAQECKEYNDSAKTVSGWTGSMFGGMPTYQITYSYPQEPVLKPIGLITRLFFTNTIAWILGYFIGFFILLQAFKVNPWISIAGAIAITLSSYFIIIIAAGHILKAVAIGLLAPIIGGFYLMYQKKYGWGILLTSVYSAIAIMLHPQMTYYTFMLIGVLFCAELFIHIKEKRWKDFITATILFGAAFGLGIATQSVSFMTNQEYSKETMRGGHSELVKEGENTNKTAGLDLTYMTQYSYGIGETSTLLIPGARGYASAYNVGTNSKVYEAMVQNGIPKRQAAEYCKNMPTYWGGDEGTSGPVYAGAIVCFLFVLGLLIVKGPYKWALLVATLFSIALAWGSNFMWFTELFAKYFPMYTKFRAVESILVVAEITMPLLGFLALKEIMEQKDSQSYNKKKMLTNIYIAAGITAGFCVLALIASYFLNFSWGRDEAIFAQWPEWLSSAVVAERAAIYRTSAFRSLIFVLLGTLAVWLYASDKLKFGYFAVTLGLLVLVDMWPIDRKFFNDGNFVKEKQDKGYFTEQPWETEILAREKGNPSYRVYNLTDQQGPFNDSRTSYRFKSIGGYSAAKLRRYQDLIDAHISKETNPMLQSMRTMDGQKYFLLLSDSTDYPVLNMLNMKYAVVGNEQPMVVENPNAMGNAWFVDSVMLAKTPNEESDALNKINLHNTLVTDVQFKDFVKDFRPHHDSSAAIKLTKYAPDYVEYDYTASQPGTVVFSEIYYPYGWNAYIDGKPVDHFRANYTLRALNVPAGKHHIRFEFRPATVEKWGKVSVACSYAIYLIILGLAGWGIYRAVRKRKTGKCPPAA
ncbi:MAG: YfhO family protein [Bacteroidales bacterium]|nr:YfhO family protein [Bacteroidales bacterium]